MTKRKTNAQLHAELAMRESELAQLQGDYKLLQRNNQMLRDQLSVHQRVPQLSMQALEAKRDALIKQGVPCKVRMGHVVHAVTGSIL